MKTHKLTIHDSLTHEEALRILTDELLGKDYICCNLSISGKQANSIIVKDILEKFINIRVTISDKDEGKQDLNSSKSWIQKLLNYIFSGINNVYYRIN